MPLARLPRAFDGFTIAQLSDFHYEDHFSVMPIRKSVEMVNGLHPDLTVLTGDFVTVPVLGDKSVSAEFGGDRRYPAPRCSDRSRRTKYAILGNHDAMSNPPLIVRALQDHDIPVLRNRSLPLERGDGPHLAGGNRRCAARAGRGSDLTLSDIPPDEATILLAHEPDFADDASLMPIDLQLSGHSHGGQVWIPGIGAPWLPPCRADIRADSTG